VDQFIRADPPAGAMTAVHPIRPAGRRRPTATSAFGVGRRESHDASGFYGRFTEPKISSDSCIADHRQRDAVWVGDARHMDRDGDIADGSVALVVTSPPYFAGKEYEAALGEGHIPADYNAYLQMLHGVFEQCLAKLEPGGRIAVNVANLGRRPYRSLSRDVIDIVESLGYLLRGEIIWQKSHAAGGSCAWGTYQRPGNPVLRDITERIIVASKGRFDRALSPEDRLGLSLPNEGSMAMDDFVDATTDLWDIPAESATRVGHPAPFPVELPRRLIELYTYRGDLVLDPFMGSGSTAVAAVRTERHYAGFDTDPAYVARADERIAAARRQLEEERGRGHGLRITVPPVRPVVSTDEGDDLQGRAVRRGEKAKEIARQALDAAGFSAITPDVTFGDLGVQVSFRAIDADGAVWLFDVSGAFSSTRPGLKRMDVLWKALGRASVLHEAHRRDPDRDDLGPLVLLSTDVPPTRSAGGRVLRAVQPDDHSGPVHDVIELLDEEGVVRLREYARDGRQWQ
jgi:site-specific DNA-methyltransferase (adenine-specific)